MAGLNINDVVHVTMFGKIGGQVTMSTFFYRVTVASTTPFYTTAAQGVAGYFTTGTQPPGLAFIQAAPQNWVCERVRCQRVHPSRGVYVDATPGLPGTVPSDAEAFNIQASITRKTVVAGRDQVGALHSAPIPSNSFLDGEITPAYSTLLGIVATRLTNTWTVTLETTELKPILWSPATPNDVFKEVVATAVQDTVRTMRRRTVRLGI